MYDSCQDNSLEHFGVKGMKWGVRRYQNADGTLTDAGKKRLQTYKTNEMNRVTRRYEKLSVKASKYGRRTGNQEMRETQRQYLQKRHKEKFDAEMRALKKMKYSDMQKELREINKAEVQSVLFTVGAFAVSTIVGSPLSPIVFPDYDYIKSVSRGVDKNFDRQTQLELRQLKKTY